MVFKKKIESNVDSYYAEHAHGIQETLLVRRMREDTQQTYADTHREVSTPPTSIPVQVLLDDMQT